MKKTILLFLLVVTTVINAQSDYRDLPGRWRLGFNMGGIWESSDVKPSPGLGGGFTIEKILNKRSNALLGFSLGLRYLGGRTYGLAATPTYDIAKNEALNGTYNTVIRYDSVPGYFFANHKTFIQEGSLELKMNFPRLEKNTGIIFHLWGGIGIGKYKTWIDALDKDGNMYDFSRLQGQHVTQSDLTRIYDGKYETLAMGSGTNGTFCVLPSIGAGLGYRVSKHVSFVLEHKISFPGTNLLDGIEYPKNCPVTGSKDFYNYTSLGLVFTFYGRSHSHSSGSTNNNTGVSPVGTTTPNTGYTTPVVNPPTVVITYPANGFNSPGDYTTVNATVHNVSSSSQINISQNGYAINHYSFNASNGALNFQTFLALGANNFVISASNSGGSASQGVTINYNPTFTTNGLSNTTTTVTTTNTVVTTHTTTTVGSPTVTPVFTGTTAATTTVSGTHTITPTFTTATTGTVTSGGTVSPTITITPTPTVSPSLTISPTPTVSPTFTTIATGTVSPATTVTPTFSTTGTGTVTANDGPFHGTATVTPLKPVVSFIDPNVYPAETTNATYNVISSVLNVADAAHILVSVNGNNVPDFVYNPTNKQVTFVAVLQLGYNTITVKGTNNAGTDSKSIVINHKQAGRPPKVTITNPSNSPFTSLQTNVIVSGYVYNVVSSAGITVTANGSPANFNYNLNTHEITVALNLSSGSTVVNIAASNPFGNDAGTITLIYKKMQVDSVANSNGGVVTHIETAQTHTYTNTPHGPPGGPHNPPVITVLSPNADPFNTNTGNVSVSATVDHITNASLVTVNYNGVTLSVMFDLASKHLNFSSPLKPGLNTFVISASNNDGTVTKSVNINYAPIGGNTNPSNSVNPVNGDPTYGHGNWNMGGLFNNGGGKTPTPANPPTDPKKTNTTVTPGTINPGRPVKTVTPSTETPKPSTNDSGTTPSKPVEGGGTQIKVKPR